MKKKATTAGTVTCKKSVFVEIAKNKYIYLMMLPAVIQYIIFRYIPIYGAQLAFKEYKASKGIFGSPWIGLENFERMFIDGSFLNALTNTFLISCIMLFGGAIWPPVLALMINELRLPRYKRVLQTVFTFPHFLSWVMVAGIIYGLFLNDGTVNDVLIALGLPKQNLLSNPKTFRLFLLLSFEWKEIGWACIIYLTALVGVDSALYEAARIDGASRIQRMIYIAIPALIPIFSLNFITSFAGLLSSNFDQIFNLYNPMVYEVADTLDTYIYRISFMQTPSYGFSTAVGLSQALASSILLFAANAVNKMLGGTGIFDGGMRS